MGNGQIKILHIEDNLDHATIIQETLVEVGIGLFNIKHADRLSEGLTWLIEERFDVVLLDLSLPDSQGIETFVKVQTQASDIPVIVISAIDDKEFAIEAVHMGAQDYLVKEQIDSNLLSRSLFYAIERKSIEEMLRESEWELKIKNKIAEIFFSIPDHKMYAQLLQVILKTMKSKYGVFGYIDQNEALVCPSITKKIWDNCQMSDKDIVFPRKTWGQSIWCRAVREKKSIYSNQISYGPKGHLPVFRSLVVPIIYQEDVIGILHVANKLTDYDERDQFFLEAIADHIAPALHARLRKESQDKEYKLIEEALQRKNQLQSVLNEMLSSSLGHYSLKEIFDRFLEDIVSIPWLILKSKGSIFLVEDKPDVLVMKSYLNISEKIQNKCARVNFGKCLCGRAASTRELLFVDSIDERHESHYEGISPHGHYCVPILSSGRVLGVLNLHVKEGYHRNKEEEEFLLAIANGLAGIIERKCAEKTLKDKQKELERISAK